MIQTVSELIAALNEQEIHWPVLIRRYSWHEKPVYVYPSEIFATLRWDLKVAWSDLATMERRRFLKELTDLFASSQISTSTFHFGFYCLYHKNNHLLSKYEGDFAPTVLGGKRHVLYSAIPSAEYVSNDDFIAETWSSLVRRKDNGPTTRHNPYLTNIRILFQPEQFEAVSGRMYYDVEWVEPLSGKFDYECRTHGKQEL